MNRVLSIINQEEDDFTTPPYLGLIVEIVRVRIDYGFECALEAWFPYWLRKHDSRDRRGEKFDCVDIGNYYLVAESIYDDEDAKHYADMLARTRLTSGFHQKWLKDKKLRKRKDLIGTCRFCGAA
jgi:hypothetical protein